MADCKKFGYTLLDNDLDKSLWNKIINEFKFVPNCTTSPYFWIKLPQPSKTYLLDFSDTGDRWDQLINSLFVLLGCNELYALDWQHDGFVDFVTTAQAFHWFNVTDFRRECMRIMKKGGRVLLIWNIRDESDVVNQELQEIYLRYCPNFIGFNGGIRKDDRRIRDFFDDRYDYVSFDHPLFFDKEKFMARSLSGSYSLKAGDKSYEDYLGAIENIFDRHSKQGMVSIANQSVAYVGE